MDFSKRYSFDNDAVENGRWFPIGGDGAKIKLARINSKRHKAATTKHQRVNQMAQGAGVTVAQEAIERAFIKTIAEGIILDWSGMMLEGVEIEYTEATAEQMLTQYPDFLEDVFGLASNWDNFRREAAKAISGNS
jgi:hypothetical protein